MVSYVKQSINVNSRYAALLTDDLPDADFCVQPTGLHNHPAWILGHVTVTLQSAAQLLGLPAQLPDHWPALFTGGTRPMPDRAAYPGKQELLEQFHGHLERISSRLETIDPTVLQQPTPDPDFRRLFPTAGDAIVFIATVHTAIHLGQLSAWRRARGMDFVLPMDAPLNKR